MQDWIHKYPGVQRLLHDDEELLYDVDGEEARGFFELVHALNTGQDLMEVPGLPAAAIGIAVQLFDGLESLAPERLTRYTDGPYVPSPDQAP
jgi:hypothetical protein